MKKNRKITDSFKNAGKGIWFCIKSERNFRVHTTASLYVLVLAFALGLSSLEFALLLVLIAVVITAETLNTAIEKLCDFACNKHNRQIGIIKDISAGAVFISALISAVVGFLLLFKPLKLLGIAVVLFTNFLYIFLFFISIIISLIYIFTGPVGVKDWFGKNLKKKGKA